MIHNNARNGSFTSSEIVRLLKEGKVKGSFGQPALTYIEEVRLEKNLGRSIDLETQAKPLTWGKLCEPFVHDQLGTEYTLCSDVTIVHPDIKCYAGSPDATKEADGIKTVADIKCPLTLKSFSIMADVLLKYSGMEAMNKIRDNHPDGEKFYQQITSNSILTKAKMGELIFFCPYKSQLDDIRLSIQSLPGSEMKKYYWINAADDDELPWLPEEGSRYKSLNIVAFPIQENDQITIIDKILRAKKEYLDGKY